MRKAKRPRKKETKREKTMQELKRIKFPRHRDDMVHGFEKEMWLASFCLLCFGLFELEAFQDVRKGGKGDKGHAKSYSDVVILGGVPARRLARFSLTIHTRQSLCCGRSDHARQTAGARPGSSPKPPTGRAFPTQYHRNRTALKGH